MAEQLRIHQSVENTALSTRHAFCEFVEALPKPFAIKKFGDSELPSEMETFDKKSLSSYTDFKAVDDDYTHLRCTGLALSHLVEDQGSATILGEPIGRTEAKILSAADDLWANLIPDGQAFTYQYSSYAASLSDPRYGQADSEYVNRFSMVVETMIRDKTTGALRPSGGPSLAPLLYLDLLPGLTYRVALGSEALQKYKIEKEELEAVCHKVEERKAANGDAILACTVRPDPFDWRDSLERQRKLNRPDVFFDIEPLRRAFSEPLIQDDVMDPDAVIAEVHRLTRKIYGARFKDEI